MRRPITVRPRAGGRRGGRGQTPPTLSWRAPWRRLSAGRRKTFSPDRQKFSWYRRRPIVGSDQRARLAISWLALAVAIVVAAAAVAGCGGGGATTTGTPGVVRLTAVEDAYVNAERPDQNYGSADG